VVAGPVRKHVLLAWKTGPEAEVNESSSLPTAASTLSPSVRRFAALDITSNSLWPSMLVYFTVYP